jgi:hypothetical protein
MMVGGHGRPHVCQHGSYLTSDNAHVVIRRIQLRIGRIRTLPYKKHGPGE